MYSPVRAICGINQRSARTTGNDINNTHTRQRCQFDRRYSMHEIVPFVAHAIGRQGEMAAVLTICREGRYVFCSHVCHLISFSSSHSISLHTEQLISSVYKTYRD